MRIVFAAAITAIALSVLSVLPSEAELERQMAEQTKDFQTEVVASWNTNSTTSTSTSTTTTTVLAATVTRSVTAKQPPTTVALSSIDVVCDEWSEVALSMGWEPHHLQTLGEIAYRESRCQYWQHRTDTDGSTCSGDYGLLQLNWNAWGTKIRERLGYECEDLLVPAVNLLVAKLVVYDEAIKAGYDCGFRPWYMTGNYCPQ